MLRHLARKRRLQFHRCRNVCVSRCSPPHFPRIWVAVCVFVFLVRISFAIRHAVGRLCAMIWRVGQLSSVCRNAGECILVAGILPTIADTAWASTAENRNGPLAMTSNKDIGIGFHLFVTMLTFLPMMDQSWPSGGACELYLPPRRAPFRKRLVASMWRANILQTLTIHNCSNSAT